MTQTTDSAHAAIGLEARRSGTRPDRRLSAQFLADLFNLIDGAIIVLAALLAKLAYLDPVHGYKAEITPYLAAALLCALITSQVFRNSRALHSAEITTAAFRPVRVLLALAASFMLLVTLAYVLKVSDLYSRGWLISWFILSFSLLILARACHLRIKRRLVADGILARYVAIIGDERAAEALAEKLGNVDGIRIAMVAPATTGIRQLHTLCPVGGEQSLDEVIIVTSGMRAECVSKVLAEISGLPVQVHLCVDEFAYDLPFHGVSRIGPTQFVNVRRNPIGPMDRKRPTIDLGLAASDFA